MKVHTCKIPLSFIIIGKAKEYSTKKRLMVVVLHKSGNNYFKMHKQV